MNPVYIQNKIDDLILDEIKDGDMELADILLLENGYNLDKINTYSKKICKQHLFLVNSIINNKRDKVLLQKAALLVENTIKNKLEKPVAYINSLVKQNRFAVQYRNLDKLNKEEIIEIIKDQNLLEIIEKLCKQDEFDKINKSNIK